MEIDISNPRNRHLDSPITIRVYKRTVKCPECGTEFDPSRIITPDYDDDLFTSAPPCPKCDASIRMSGEDDPHDALDGIDDPRIIEIHGWVDE